MLTLRLHPRLPLGNYTVGTSSGKAGSPGWTVDGGWGRGSDSRLRGGTEDAGPIRCPFQEAREPGEQEVVHDMVEQLGVGEAGRARTARRGEADSGRAAGCPGTTAAGVVTERERAAATVVEPVHGGSITVLIIGGSGFLGTELVRQASAAGHTTVATYAAKPGAASPTTWRHLDLRDAASLDAARSEVRPQLVLNASSGSADWATTAEGPVRLAMAAARYRTRMVHVSSDAVFSGAHVHYDESSLPLPLSQGMPLGGDSYSRPTVLCAARSGPLRP